MRKMARGKKRAKEGIAKKRRRSKKSDRGGEKGRGGEKEEDSGQPSLTW